jgi:SAM-dependent methyltransferase
VDGATDATLAAYQDGANLYCAASSGDVAPSVATLLDALVERLSAGSRVLEVGSGPGVEAQYLEDRGLTVERTDATPAFVELLQQRGHRARLLDVRTDELGGPYDAVLANAVLLHLDRDDAERALASCHTATRNGGLLALTLKEGDGESWSSAKLGRPRWFVYWREAALRDVLERLGWNVRHVRRADGKHEPWLLALCEK